MNRSSIQRMTLYFATPVLFTLSILLVLTWSNLLLGEGTTTVRLLITLVVLGGGLFTLNLFVTKIFNSQARDFDVDLKKLQQINEDLQEQVQGHRVDLLRITEELTQYVEDAKMIAYNASIEASGAGEFGSTFEVVAKEIRRIADNLSDVSVQLKVKLNEMERSIHVDQNETTNQDR